MITFQETISYTKLSIIELILFNLCFYFFPWISFLITIISLYHAYKKYSEFLLPFSIKLKRKTSMKSMLENPKESNIIFSEKTPIPKILKPNELLIKIYSSSINPVDYKFNISKIPILRWYFFPYFNIGRDISGIIIDKGEKVTKFNIGDFIYGFSKKGSLQEYTISNENEILKKPENINFNEASSLPLITLTAYQSLFWFYNKEELKDKKILIIGASGGVGHIGIQLSKYFNMKVYGICSSKNSNFVLNYGIEKVFNYDNNESLNNCLNEKFDFIFDTVSSYEKIDGNQYDIYCKTLSNNGKYVCINGNFFKFFFGVINSFFNIKLFEKKNHHLHLLMKFRYNDIENIGKIIEEGKIKPYINVREFNKDEVVKAFDELKGRRTKGKIVFEIFKDETK